MIWVHNRQNNNCEKCPMCTVSLCCNLQENVKKISLHFFQRNLKNNNKIKEKNIYVYIFHSLTLWLYMTETFHTVSPELFLWCDWNSFAKKKGKRVVERPLISGSSLTQQGHRCVKSVWRSHHYILKVKWSHSLKIWNGKGVSLQCLFLFFKNLFTGSVIK